MDSVNASVNSMDHGFIDLPIGTLNSVGAILVIWILFYFWDVLKTFEMPYPLYDQNLKNESKLSTEFIQIDKGFSHWHMIWVSMLIWNHRRSLWKWSCYDF